MQASPSLLATYLAAAARQALDGVELSARSHWAIAHAREQIQANHDVITEKETFLTSAPSAGAQQLQPDEEPDLAEIVLSVHPVDSGERDIASRKELAATELRNVLEDLRALSGEENTAATKEAAQHLLQIFGTPAQGAAA